MAVTVLEAIQKGAEFLGKKNVESPRLHAELLLGHLLKLPRMKLYLNFDRVLAPAETDALRELVIRRGRREPLQHIVGSTSFCGLEMSVNRHALVPRPETELLAELGWEFLLERRRSRGQAELKDAPLNPGGSEFGAPFALDFGTGTGCLAIALAAKCPTASIIALEISPEALALARQNAAANQVSERIEFVLGNDFSSLAGDGHAAGAAPFSFDLIISNPPYIPSAEIATLEPEVREFDPRAALDGGADGLDFYRILAAQAGRVLKPDGKLMLEFGDGQAADIKKILEDEKWIVEAVKEDYNQRARIIIARINQSDQG